MRGLFCLRKRRHVTLQRQEQTLPPKTCRDASTVVVCLQCGSGHQSPPPLEASAPGTPCRAAARRRRAGAARRGGLLPARPHLPAHQPAAAGGAALCGRAGAGRPALVRVRGALHPGCAPAAGGAPAAVRTGSCESPGGGWAGAARGGSNVATGRRSASSSTNQGQVPHRC